MDVLNQRDLVALIMQWLPAEARQRLAGVNRLWYQTYLRYPFRGYRLVVGPAFQSWARFVIKGNIRVVEWLKRGLEQLPTPQRQLEYDMLPRFARLSLEPWARHWSDSPKTRFSLPRHYT